MIVTMPGRRCRHLYAVPGQDCPRHHAITWCPTCSAEWCEVPPGLTDATGSVRLAGLCRHTRLGERTVPTPRFRHDRPRGLNVRCRGCGAEWCSVPPLVPARLCADHSGAPNGGPKASCPACVVATPKALFLK